MNQQNHEKTLTEEVIIFLQSFYGRHSSIVNFAVAIMLFFLDILNFFCISLISVKNVDYFSKKLFSLFRLENISNLGISPLKAKTFLGCCFFFVFFGLFSFGLHLVTQKLVKYFTDNHPKFRDLFSLIFPVVIVIVSSLFMLITKNRTEGLSVACTMYGFLFYLVLNNLSFEVKL